MELSRQYVAGLFDGEGHVSITSSVRRSGNDPKLCVKITNTHLPVLLQVKLQYGGTLYKTKKSQEHYLQCYNLSFTVEQSKTFLNDIFPYLFVKKEQAALALQFASTVYRRGRKAVSFQEKSLREECMRKVRLSKTREWATVEDCTLGIFKEELNNLHDDFIQNRKLIPGENHAD